jgi:hypothetical protein
MDERNKGDMSKPRMAKRSSRTVSRRQTAVDPAHLEPGRAGVPEGGAGNENLGSVPAVSRGRKKSAPAQPKLPPQIEALFRDTAACAEAARRWSDGPGRLWRDSLPPQPGAVAAMEHLAMHTRLMQVMNWLLDPDHNAPIAGVKPFPHAATAALPDDHPIRHTDGLAVAQTSRTIFARAIALAAAHPLATEDPK